MEKVWYPLVLAKQNTPRAAKRFVNRVRYLAMRQRGYQEDTSAWERVLFPDRLREPARTKDWQPIPEPLLVALSALEQMQPQWIYNEAAFSYVAGDNGTAELMAKFRSGLPNAVNLLENARETQTNVFGSNLLNQSWRLDITANLSEHVSCHLASVGADRLGLARLKRTSDFSESVGHSCWGMIKPGGGGT
jgi:hypothetical protein